MRSGDANEKWQSREHRAEVIEAHILAGYNRFAEDGNAIQTKRPVFICMPRLVKILLDGLFTLHALAASLLRRNGCHIFATDE